jgi:hypothetical protein
MVSLTVAANRPIASRTVADMTCGETGLRCTRMIPVLLFGTMGKSILALCSEFQMWTLKAKKSVWPGYLNAVDYSGFPAFGSERLNT